MPLRKTSNIDNVKKQAMPLRSYSENSLDRDVKKLEKQIMSMKLSIDNHANELVDKKKALEEYENELKSLQFIKSIVLTVSVLIIFY